MTLSLRTISEHRSFEAVCLGLLDARSYLQQKDGELRPVLITFACMAQEFKPFVANILERRMLELHYYAHATRPEHAPLSVMKSAGYDFATQVVPGREGHDEEGNPTKAPDKMIGTFYLARAFSLEPANPDDEMCEFIMLPTREQLETNAARLDNRAIVTHLLRTGRSDLPATWLRYFGALSCLWAGYVDRRVHAPIIQEPAFFAHALYDAMKAGLVEASTEIDVTAPMDTRGRGYSYYETKPFPPTTNRLRSYNLEALGFALPALQCCATEEQMQGLLAEAIKSYSTVMSVNSGAIELPEGI